MKMKMKHGAIIALGIIFIAAVGIGSSIANQEVTLEFGMFAGSNWDVANADSCVIIDKAIARFEASHPNVNVHYYSGIPKEDYSEWLTQKTLQGETPDVFMVLADDFDKMVSLGMLASLDEMILQDQEFDTDKYFSSALAYGEREEHQYALPYETVPTLMFVNKTLLTKEGFAVPDSEWTWEHLQRICQRVTKDTDGDGKIDQFGTYNYDWTEAAYSNGGKLFDEDGTQCYINSDEVAEAVKFVNTLNELNDGERVTREDFDGGKVAFMPLSFAEYRTYKTYPYKIKKYTNFQWDCITLPSGPSGDNISEVNSLLIGISEKSNHKKLAWEFLKTLTYNEEIQMEIFRDSQGASVLKNVTGSKQAEEILKQDTEEEDKIIDNELLSSVIEQGAVTPRFAKYEDALAMAEGEVLKIYEDEKNIDSSLKIARITLNHFLRE